MAESGDKSDLEKVRAELICSICLDLLCEPKKLNCDHSFCQKCLEIHIQKSPRQTPVPPDPTDRSPAPTDKPNNVIVCACCREETQLPENGVEGLKTNFKLKNLVEILSSQEREKTVQDLGKGHYRRFNQAVPKCTLEHHESEYCVFFCKTCNELFCRFCIPMHKTKQHEWDNYDSILSQYKEELRWSIQPAYEAAQSACDAVQELQKDMEAVRGNTDSVKGKIREYFSTLVSELHGREQTLMNMADCYTKVKMESLQKLCTQLQNGQTSLLQNIQRIESQMQEDSVDLLTGKEKLKAKMVLHRNTIRRSLPHTDDVDTFIELKTESQVPVATLGHLVFCQRNPRTGIVSTVRNFVETDDMKHIHLDLARPLDQSVTAPQYIQFQIREEPQPVYDETYEDLAPAPPPIPGEALLLPQSIRRSMPLPPAPFEESDSFLGESTYAKIGDGELKAGDAETKNVSRRRAKPSEEDPYDTIPAYKGSTLPASIRRSSTVPREGLYTLRSKPGFLRPERVIELHNADAHVSGIICTHRYGNIVLTDTNNRCIRILGDEGEVIHTFGAPEFDFVKPVALARDSGNDLYVLDQESKMFHKLRLNGDCLFSFPTKSRKAPEKPWDIAVSPDNTIYISDWSRRRVYVYNGQNGKKIRSIRGCYRRGKKDEFVEFSRPAGITFDLGGRLMIADRGERCVWCINTEGDELIKTIGDGHIQDPYSIAVAKDGKIVVTESESDCVSVFGDDGELLHYFGGTGTEEGQLCRPHHVFVDTNMKIYIADTQNKRVQIFSLPEETLYQNLIPASTLN